jgi:predicted permease
MRWNRRMRAGLQRDIDDHIARETAEHIARGCPPDEARRRARLAFGNVLAVQESTRAVWKWTWLEGIFQDVRYAARSLRSHAAFSAVVVLSLAIGIGSTAAAFSIADAVLFRPLAVAAPHELHEFRAVVNAGAGTKVLTGMTSEELRLLNQSADAGELVGFRTLDGISLVVGAARHDVRADLVSGEYFNVLRPALGVGRALTPDDARQTPIPIVISEPWWERTFASDPAAIGRPLTLNGASAVIVGVVRQFQGLLAERPADVMVPEASGSRLDPATVTANLRVVARLRRGTTAAAAEQQLTRLYRDIAFGANSLVRPENVRVALLPAAGGASDARERLQRPLLLALVFGAVMLLVACANSAGLLLARAASRGAEFAVRTAIGAGRARLVRLLVAESALTSVLAGVAGLLIARIAAPIALSAVPLDSVPRDFDLRLDARLAGFIALAATTAGLIAAAPTILRVLRSDTSIALARNDRTVVPSRQRLTRVLVAVQVACTLLLLVSGGAMVRSLINLSRVNPGFEPAGLVAIAVDAGRVTDDRLASVYADLHARIGGAPHVEGVTSAQFGIMTSATTTGTVDLAGWSPRSDDDRWVRMFWVGADFFGVLRMPVIAGSAFGGSALAGRERVAVVNRSFADFYFGSPANAVGRMINGDVRIIGVAADAYYGSLRDDPVRAMFVPYTQAPPRKVRTFLARSSGDPSLTMAAGADAVRTYDPALAVSVATVPDQIAASQLRERFIAACALVLAGLAMFLSCAGLFAAVAYSVAQRRRELAIRLALGAAPREIVRTMAGGAMRVTGIGLILGLPGAYAITRAMEALLFGVAPFDLPTVAASAVGVAAAAAVAGSAAARRAAAISPLECLNNT